MKQLSSSKTYSFFDDTGTGRFAKNTEVRGGPGHSVSSFFELAQKIAELQFRNRDQFLLFRGQNRDYRTTKSNSMIKPSIFRNHEGKIPSPYIISERYNRLRTAEDILEQNYQRAHLLGQDEVGRKPVIRWAILQHYDVCATPLLDVTHSLRTAASFAASGNDTKEGFVFVFAVPNLSGAITISSDADMQTIRLSSACPPSAVRAHIQEGYLLGEYPEIDNYRKFKKYNMWELDFGRRLVAKFRLDPNTFWNSKVYPPVPDEALYPDRQSDSLLEVIDETKAKLAEKA